MNIKIAIQALDKIIKKSRVHLYKPIQIAEILYRDRTEKDITLSELETYRNPSKKWRDIICMRFLGRISTSSARYQDDVFNQNAMPPSLLGILGKENRGTNGKIEAYIYAQFAKRFTQMNSALDYCKSHKKETFQLSEFLDLFWKEKGLKRSIDKVYEIVVFALFSSLVEALEIEIEVSYPNSKKPILTDFSDFSSRILKLSTQKNSFKTKAKINRVGVTNAADRGLDMWASFGLAIQIKHLTLSEEMAKNIVRSITADRIVIVCKQAEQKIILSLLNQIGWKSRIQAIITEVDLINWFEKALRGVHNEIIGNKVIQTINDEIEKEFPSTKNTDFQDFFQSRNYHSFNDFRFDTKD